MQSGRAARLQKRRPEAPPRRKCKQGVLVRITVRQWGTIQQVGRWDGEYRRSKKSMHCMARQGHGGQGDKLGREVVKRSSSGKSTKRPSKIYNNARCRGRSKQWARHRASNVQSLRAQKSPLYRRTDWARRQWARLQSPGPPLTRKRAWREGTQAKNGNEVHRASRKGCYGVEARCGSPAEGPRRAHGRPARGENDRKRAVGCARGSRYQCRQGQKRRKPAHQHWSTQGRGGGASRPRPDA